MENVTSKKFGSAAAAFLLAGLSYLAVSLVFDPGLNRKRSERDARLKTLARFEALVRQKNDLQTAWEAQRKIIPQASSAEEALNQWVKDLLSYAQQDSITLSKIEPQGIKETPDGKALRLFLQFHGDIRKLVRCLHHLLQADPLARAAALSVREGEDKKTFVYELVLEKWIFWV